MNDFFAAFPAYTKEQLQEIVRNPPAKHAPSVVALLAQTVAGTETKLQGQEIYRQVVESAPFSEQLKGDMRLLESLDLTPPQTLNLEGLPKYSFYLRIDFHLASPLLSRDDRVFSVTENPVRKDWVFGLPMVSPTTWKGAMRSACSSRYSQQQVEALFGPRQEDDEEVKAFKGRIFFYPSFFSSIGFEMFNPHDRETRVGKNPISMECVPAGSASRFALLYAPIYSERLLDPQKVACDVEAVTQSCQAMMLELGFSAKKSSGYGAASPKLGKLQGEIHTPGSAPGAYRIESLHDLGKTGEQLAQILRGLS